MPALATVLERCDRIVEQLLGGIGAAADEHAELIAAHSVGGAEVLGGGGETATETLQQRVSRRVAE